MRLLQSFRREFSVFLCRARFTFKSIAGVQSWALCCWCGWADPWGLSTCWESS